MPGRFRSNPPLAPRVALRPGGEGEQRRSPPGGARGAVGGGGVARGAASPWGSALLFPLRVLRPRPSRQPDCSLSSDPAIGSAAPLAGAPPGTGGRLTFHRPGWSRLARSRSPPSTTPPPPRSALGKLEAAVALGASTPAAAEVTPGLPLGSAAAAGRAGTGGGAPGRKDQPGVRSRSRHFTTRRRGEARADARSGTQSCGQSFTLKGGGALCLPPDSLLGCRGSSRGEDSWFRGRGLRGAPRARRTRCSRPDSEECGRAKARGWGE